MQTITYNSPVLTIRKSFNQLKNQYVHLTWVESYYQQHQFILKATNKNENYQFIFTLGPTLTIELYHNQQLSIKVDLERFTVNSITNMLQLLVPWTKIERRRSNASIRQTK